MLSCMVTTYGSERCLVVAIYCKVTSPISSIGATKIYTDLIRDSWQLSQIPCEHKSRKSTLSGFHTYLPTNPPTHPSIIYLSIYLSIYPSTHLSNLSSIYLSIIYLSIHPSVCLSGFLTAVAVFRKPNAIPLCFSIDLFLNFLLPWLLVLLPSTFFLDVLFSFSPFSHLHS